MISSGVVDSFGVSESDPIQIVARTPQKNIEVNVQTVIQSLENS
jgi:hypothetical protein